MDEYAHEPCYVFKPSANASDDQENRPRKKRKVVSAEPDKNDYTWPRLLGGLETTECTELRQKMFYKYWTVQEKLIDGVISIIDLKTLDAINAFVDGSNKTSSSKIPTALLVSGPMSSLQHQVLSTWTAKQSSQNGNLLVQLNNVQANNLQNTLKNIIKNVIVQTTSPENYQDYLNKHKQRIPLNYDLELLRVFVSESSVKRIIISVLDVETFDISILSELLLIFSSWMGSIPFVLFIGVSTTVQLFESRLSRSTISFMKAQEISLNSEQDSFWTILREVQGACLDSLILDGPAIAVLDEMLQDANTSLLTFKRVLKYMYMSHFFTNPLSAILTCSEKGNIENPKHLRSVITHCQSFRKLCEYWPNKLHFKPEDPEEVQKMLKDDFFLVRRMAEAVSSSTLGVQTTHMTAMRFCNLYKILRLPYRSSFELYSQVLERRSDFATTELLADVVDAVRHLDITNVHVPPESWARGFNGAPELVLGDITDWIGDVMDKRSNVTTPIDSDGSSNGFSKEDLETLARHVESVLCRGIQPIDDFLMQEAFVVRVPPSFLRNKIRPRPRQAIERALGNPADYLNCECCSVRRQADHDTTAARSSLPSTSTMYQLLGEAGATINARDLLDAFCNSIGAEDDAVNGQQHGTAQMEDNENNERIPLTHFYTALSELRMLGLVKQGKRKPGLAAGVDLLAKTTWAGM